MTLRTIALAAALALPCAASAEPFTIFIWETPEEIALRADPGEAGQAYWAAYAAFGQAIGPAMVGGAPLMVTPADGDGGLILGGYFQIEAESLAAADALAALAPAETRGGDAIAVAQIPTDAMMAGN